MIKISQTGINFIKKEEGLRTTAYLDSVSVWTIGFGHTGPEVRGGLVITEERAEELLRKDIEKCEAAIAKGVKVELTQNQVDALCSFIFNVGVGAFLGSTLLKRINEKAANNAIRAEFMRWDKGTIGGKKVALKGLTVRRGREADMYCR